MTDVEIIEKTSAIIKFQPSMEEQRQFAIESGTKESEGICGKFIVQYDVSRDPNGSEVQKYNIILQLLNNIATMSRFCFKTATSYTFLHQIIQNQFQNIQCLFWIPAVVWEVKKWTA